MKLLEVERFVAKKGVFGCPLSQIPPRLASELKSSPLLLIVEHGDNLEMPELIGHNKEHVKTHNPESLEADRSYDVRFMFENWRRLAFNQTSIYTSKMARYCTVLLNSPGGISKKEAKNLVPGLGKNLTRWIRMLNESNVLMTETINGHEVEKYNLEIIDGDRDFPYDYFILSEKQNEELGQLKNKKRIKRIFTADMMTRAEDIVKESSGGVVLKVLCELLNVDASESTVGLLCKEFSSNPRYQLDKRKRRYESVVRFIGELNSQFIDTDMLNFLVDTFHRMRITIFSEMPKEVKNMKKTLGLEDNKLLDILEDQNFTIIEIKQKYTNSEVIVFSDSIEQTNPAVLQAIEKCKDKIDRHFQTKIKYTFLKNSYLNSFDNNYSPFFKEQILCFYRFIVSQMKKNGNYFSLGVDLLLEMNFVSFIKCVPLRQDFQFLKIVSEIASQISVKSFDMVDIESMSDEQFDMICKESLEATSKYTLEEILEMLKESGENHRGLAARVSVHEFDRIMDAMISYNIFEGFSDENYLYFEQIHGIEAYIDRILLDIKEDSGVEGTRQIVPFLIRRRFYNMICGISQDEFYQKAQEVINKNFEGDIADFFTKKLQAYK